MIYFNYKKIVANIISITNEENSNKHYDNDYNYLEVRLQS